MTFSEQLFSTRMRNSPNDQIFSGLRMTKLVALIFVVFAVAAAAPSLDVDKTSATPVCPKCVAHKESGKLTCCARGGAWFQKCGNIGNSNFDHTWIEGIRACQSAFPSGFVL